MSIWTHVSAILRIDDMSVYGDNPTNWSKVFIESTYGHWNENCNLPKGSEGSLNVNISAIEEEGIEYMKTVSIFGDLRDYEDILGIRDWWVNIRDQLPKDCDIRQGILLADCENGKRLILTHDDIHNKEKD